MALAPKEPLTLDSILDSPATVASVYRGHLATLDTGKLDERRSIAHLHVLKLLLGRQYDGVVTESVLGALRQKVKDGECDRLTLEEVDRNGVQTFEGIKGDKVTGFHVYERGILVVATHVVDGEPIAKTMYSVFKDPSQREHASEAQRYTHAVAEFAQMTAVDPEILRILSRCSTMEPTYSDGGLLGNLFLADAQDLHDTLKTGNHTLEDRYALLRDKAAIDLALGFYANAFAQTAPGRKLAGRAGGQVFETRDHERLLLEKVFMRADPALRNRFVRDWISADGKHVADMAKAREYIAGREGKLIQALGVDGTKDMTFVHGDNLPSNTMVGRDKAGKTVYTPIDFEFACKDFIEGSLVQCWAKAGIYDHTGASLAMGDGRTIEDALLTDATNVMRKLDANFDDARFRERFGRLKAENYLLWAARYHHYSQSRHVKNPEESQALMHYYATLFTKEMVKQGIASGADDPLLKPVTALFGDPLDDATMRDIHERHVPEQRSHSVLHTDFDVDAEGKLDELVRRHKWKQRKRKIGMVSGVATASALMLALAFTAGRYRDQVLDYQYQEETASKNEEWSRIYDMMLPDSDPRIEKETEMYRFMARMYGEGSTALAAVYAPDLVKRIVQHYQTMDWTVVEEHLPRLLVQQMRRYTFGGYIDSWMMRPACPQARDGCAPAAIDANAHVFKDYRDCEMVVDGIRVEPCPLTPETRAGKEAEFGNNWVFGRIRDDPWYRTPFRPPRQKAPSGPMFGGQ